MTESHPFYQFCEELAESTQHYRVPPLLFRGQADKDWEITSGIYRRLSDEGIITKSEVNPKIISDEIEMLIDGCKLRESSYPAIKHSSTFELLAEVQHMGGKTPFIDFSFSAITALYFACAHHNDKNGIVSVIYPYHHENIQHFPVGATETWQEIANESFHHLFYWQPPRTNYRVLKQDSVFAFNSAGKIQANDLSFTIEIKSKDKPKILQKLKQLANVDFDAIYPDFLGYLKGGENE